ncbi:hypothetical protein ATANTOWER_028549, partial [Ataeniobius toweri]|nr:hypothetical protein [Ataeniobius toweri]
FGDLHCSFDRGLCGWISDREGDLHWEAVDSPAGGRYLSVPELKAGQRSNRGARLAVDIVPLLNQGDMCFSFSHWLTGHHVGVLQLFIRKKGRDQRYGSALWSRTGGHGWRQTQVTLETHSVDKVSYAMMIMSLMVRSGLMMTKLVRKDDDDGDDDDSDYIYDEDHGNDSDDKNDDDDDNDDGKIMTDDEDGGDDSDYIYDEDHGKIMTDDEDGGDDDDSD